MSDTIKKPFLIHSIYGIVVKEADYKKLLTELEEAKERADHLQSCLTQDNDKLDTMTIDLAAAREKCLKLEGAMTLADKIICTCGYAGRPELRNGIRAAHTVMSVALGKELPLHMIEEAELVKKDVLDDWPGNTKESP